MLNNRFLYSKHHVTAFLPAAFLDCIGECFSLIKTQYIIYYVAIY